MTITYSKRQNLVVLGKIVDVGSLGASLVRAGRGKGAAVVEGRIVAAGLLLVQARAGNGTPGVKGPSLHALKKARLGGDRARSTDVGVGADLRRKRNIKRVSCAAKRAFVTT